jgi:hypothetical protein
MLAACLALTALADSAVAQSTPAPSGTDTPTTIIDLQPFRRSTDIDVEGAGGRRGKATLVDLNPQINAWFVLTLDWGRGSVSYHLENPQPHEQQIRLADAHGLTLSRGKDSIACDLWSGQAATALETARRSSLPYAPLCDGRLYLRNSVAGGYTQLEKVTGFLRSHVWGGEEIIGFTRRQFFGDAFLEKGSPAATPEAPASAPPSANDPLPAALNPSDSDHAVVPEHLGIELAKSGRGVSLGQWYPAVDQPGIYVSVMQPQAVAPDILASDRGTVASLDPVESAALVYLVAFDLEQFDLGFALGTEHPAVGWSERVLDSVRDPKLPGPDGIGSVAPLVRTGMISPAFAAATAATFTGGFKREHGAFRYGALAQQNRGSHYGFVEQGTVFSKLQPGLATLYVLDDGSVDMKTWTAADDALLPRVKYARQNGVALVQYDSAKDKPVPGALVARWGAGNWSGSTDEKLRALRAGACIQQTPSRRFLIYGYFSSATPSAMARVFQAYGCRYAMHLDMNALEHTYLALYRRRGKEVEVEHLVEGMQEVDKKVRGQMVPRFLGFPDNRDFFYLVRRGARQ